SIAKRKAWRAPAGVESLGGSLHPGATTTSHEANQAQAIAAKRRIIAAQHSSWSGPGAQSYGASVALRKAASPEFGPFLPFQGRTLLVFGLVVSNSALSRGFAL